MKTNEDKTHVRGYGWVPDLPDIRDHKFTMKVGAAMSLPTSVDLRSGQAPVYDQGQLGSCTGNAIAAAIQYDRIKQKASDALCVPSRLFIYYEERVVERTVKSDSGAQIRDGIKVVARNGTCFETGPSSWPYDITKFAEKPASDCYVLGKKDRALTYQRLNSSNLTELKSCLAGGTPFVFGFTVYESFEGPDVAKTGIVPMPRAGESVLGGHAVLCVGYDDSTGKVIVRNSWGTSWGITGYFMIPYQYLTNTNLADDFWSIQTVSN